ncbi:MAG TPA: GntR family transcriptional regulator [Xanthobacteraceae bacterium]|nr:GntR family transcriptional regulator [Xanthobacteraceae bacterium]
MRRWSESNSDHARVYNEIKAMVIDYRFRPGEQLRIGELADRLRVSSTPIREALIRLQAESLLDPVPRRGFFAKTLTSREMIDLYQFGFLIVKQTLERHFDAIDIATCDGLVSAHGATVASDQAPDQPERPARRYARYLEQLYEKVVFLSRNEVMIATIRNFVDRTHYVRVIDLEVPRRYDNALHAISEILAALEQRDVGRIIATLERELSLKIAIMPALVREGVSRAYTSVDAPPRTTAIASTA